MADNSKPAFPVYIDVPNPENGLTKREWYAGLAMQGALANGVKYEKGEIAKMSVLIADELIEELNK